MGHLQTRYPLATLDGQQIRADLLKAVGTIKKAFTTTGTTAEDLPAGSEILRLRATQDCWFLNADAVAAAPVSASPSVIVNSICFIPADEWVLLAIDPDVLKYSVVRDTVDGDLLIHVIQKWNLLALDVQVDHT